MQLCSNGDLRAYALGIVAIPLFGNAVKLDFAIPAALIGAIVLHRVERILAGMKSFAAEIRARFFIRFSELVLKRLAVGCALQILIESLERFHNSSCYFWLPLSYTTSPARL